MSAEVDEQAVVDAALPHLPIFPLPSSALIPGGHLPLHIFEPRYREMIADVLAEDRVLAVALLAPGWETEYQGRPPVYSIVGAGYVQAAERLADGRYNILLHGVRRARVLEELEVGKSYRVVRTEPVADVLSAPERPILEAQSQTLRQLVLDLAAALPDNAAVPLAEACVRERDPGKLADLVGAAVLVDHRQRQEFLEEFAVARRLDQVSDTVAQVLLQVSGGAGGGGYLM
ncbi:LON peptidase substrate-binding domain-containing protein [Vulgatibacter sp.]|uniref:LON peptidase substrate-binding domain-containing protein n=1 Tax=Vulgatibacter sp. TaxID=1971226 RepID=UPI0035672FBE